MMTPCMAVGKVTRIFTTEPREDKRPFLRVTLTWEEFTGTEPDGSPRHASRFVTCVAFGQNADGMKALRAGDIVSAQGRVQAGRPYQNARGEYVAYLELHVEKWQLVARLTSDRQTSPSPNGEPVAPAAREETTADQISDPFV